MSINYLVIAELAFLMIASWAIGVSILRAINRDKQKAQELADKRKLKYNALRLELQKAQDKIAELQATAAAADAADGENLEALINIFAQDLEADAQNLQELEDTQSTANTSIERLVELQADKAAESWDVEQMRAELTLLREQTNRSGRVINELTKALDRNRARVRELERRSRELYRLPPVTRDDSRQIIRKLNEENRLLQTRMQREVETHQITLERITAMLRDSDAKYCALVKSSSEEKFSMTAAIEHLREQLSQAADQKMTAVQVEELMARLREMDDALSRSTREREFLDARFIELEQALEQAESAYEELDRTKTEFRMLEERYLQMEKLIDGEGSAGNTATAAFAEPDDAESSPQKPVWQAEPITPQIVEFDNAIVDTLAPKS